MQVTIQEQKSSAADQPPKLRIWHPFSCAPSPTAQPTGLPGRNIDPYYSQRSSGNGSCHTKHHAAFNQESWHDSCTETSLHYQAPLPARLPSERQQSPTES